MFSMPIAAYNPILDLARHTSKISMTECKPAETESLAMSIESTEWAEAIAESYK